MADGHAEYGEIFLALFLIIGLVTASMVYNSYQKGDFSTKDSTARMIGDVQSPIPSVIPVSNTTSNLNSTTQAVSIDGGVRTTNDLLYEGLGRASTRFSSTSDHNLYSSESFMWAIAGNQTPVSIPVKENDLRASLVRFDGRYIDTLRGFAFTVFTPPPSFIAPESIRGVAVFLSNGSELDAFERSSTQFIVSYDPHPRRSQTIEGCEIVDTMRLIYGNDTCGIVYDIDCKLIYTTYP